MPRKVRSLEVRIEETEDKLDRLKLQKNIRDMRAKIRARRRRR